MFSIGKGRRLFEGIATLERCAGTDVCKVSHMQHELRMNQGSLHMMPQLCSEQQPPQKAVGVDFN